MGLWGLYPLAVHRQSLPLLPRQTYTPDSTLYTLCYGIKIESAAGWQKKTRAAMEFRETWKFFSLRPPGRKRKEISVWVLWVK